MSPKTAAATVVQRPAGMQTMTPALYAQIRASVRAVSVTAPTR
jgi:hypothetical protein